MREGDAVKKKDFWANRQTVPHIKLLTRLIWLFGIFSGLNVIVTAACAHGVYGGNKLYSGLVIGAILVVITYCKATSPTKGHRDVYATISDGCLFCIITVTLMVFFFTWELSVLLGVEIIVILAAIFAK